MEHLLAAFLLLFAPSRAWAGPMPVNGELIRSQFPVTRAPDLIHARQASEEIVSTCGYLTGNLSNSWVAPGGFQCATDVAGGYFGFCSNDTLPSDCKPPRGCVDKHDCENGCGDSTRQVQCTATSRDYCWSDFLVAGTDASSTYTYYVCRDKAGHGVVSAFSAFVTKSFDFVVSTTQLTTSPTASPASTGTSSLPTATIALTTGMSSGAPAQTSTPATQPKSGSSSNVGAFVGGVLGGLALILAAVIAFVVLRRKGKQQQSNSKAAKEAVTEGASTQPPEYTEKSDRFAYLHEMEHPPTELTVQERGPLFVSELAADEEVTAKKDATRSANRLSAFKYGFRRNEGRGTREQSEMGNEAQQTHQNTGLPASQEPGVSPLEEPASRIRPTEANGPVMSSEDQGKPQQESSTQRPPTSL